MSENKTMTEQRLERVMDTEHISARAGTLLVSTNYEKSSLGTHDIDKIDTNALAMLKTTKDGKTVLIPQPTDDPNEALNWSWARKHKVLAVLVYCTLMTDLTSAWEIPLIIPQAEHWKISANDAGRNLSGNIFMLAVGGVLAVPLTRWIGRLPVIFWSMLLGFCMTIFATNAPGWISYIVARCLQGLFITTPQVVGLSMIHDMFFFHERARKIGIWATTFIFSPFLGPFLSGIMVNYTTWQNSLWLNVGLIGLGLLLVVTLAEETLYQPHIPEEKRPIKTGFIGRFNQLVGINGFKTYRGGVAKVVGDMLLITTRPQLLFLCVFYMCSFMWSIGINATLVLFVSPPPPIGFGYSNLKVSLMYIAPMLFSLMAELFGHYFNDFIALRSIRRSGGTYEAEVRLWTIWISLPFFISGLVFFGFSLHKVLPWICICISWGFYQFALVTTTVAITAYALDIFPDHSVEAAAIVNMFRALGGFIVNYFQVDWAKSIGPQNSFGIEAGIVGAGFIAVILVQIYGKLWRGKFPAPPAH